MEQQAQLKKPFSVTMELLKNPFDGETAMATSGRLRPTAGSFLDCLSYFLTPQVWKQVQQAFQPWRSLRWRPQPLVFVMLVMTWCTGDSLPERFETARAFYVASYQRKRRPGKTVEGFSKAWTRLPAAAMRAVADALRRRLAQVFAEHLQVEGFVPLGCDGSRLACPRTAPLQQRLGGESQGSPQIWVTAIVHLSLGLLWSWRLGKGNASERSHLRQLIRTLPAAALLVADAGYPGYEVLQALHTQGVHFLMRLSSRAPLYATERVALSGFREGLVYYWPQKAQQQQFAPLQVRLLRIHGRHADVWLITNVLTAERLSRHTAGQFYRWRWRNEGLFRTYKRTLGKVKLMSHTVAMAHREAEGSLLAVQLLLAQGSLALNRPGTKTVDAKTVVRPSARKVLLTIRAEVRNVTGMYLGPRQRQTYLERLEQARGDTRRRRRNQVRQPWPGRTDHKPPHRPKILKMGTDLKRLLATTLDAA